MRFFICKDSLKIKYSPELLIRDPYSVLLYLFKCLAFSFCDEILIYTIERVSNHNPKALPIIYQKKIIISRLNYRLTQLQSEESPVSTTTFIKHFDFSQEESLVVNTGYYIRVPHYTSSTPKALTFDLPVHTPSCLYA